MHVFLAIENEKVCDLVLTKLLILLASSALTIGAFTSCSGQPEVRVPEQRTMHFPTFMALNGQNLVISSSSADGKYSFARAISVNTKAIKSALDSGQKKDPIDWNSVVRSNTLIPQEIGEIYLSDSMVFASRENGRIYTQPLSSTGFACNNPSQLIDECDKASSLKLSELDPFSLGEIASSTDSKTIAVGYLSASNIDLVKIEKNSESPISVIKTIDAKKLMLKILGSDKLNGVQFITRKIFVAKATSTSKKMVYFLIEPAFKISGAPTVRLDSKGNETLTTKNNPNKSGWLTKNLGTHLVSISADDLLSSNEVDSSSIASINLKDLFSITKAQDVFIDETNNHAYVLSRVPEALFKIDLTSKALIESNFVCSGVTSIAVNKSNEQIYLPCYHDNRLVAYSMKTLHLETTSPVQGRGPVFVQVDEANSLIYSSFSNDGTVVIFNFELEYLGYLFDKAPNNRVGSK